jgi:hypothetical protein
LHEKLARKKREWWRPFAEYFMTTNDFSSKKSLTLKLVGLLTKIAQQKINFTVSSLVRKRTSSTSKGKIFKESVANRTEIKVASRNGKCKNFVDAGLNESEVLMAMTTPYIIQNQLDQDMFVINSKGFRRFILHSNCGFAKHQ